MLSFIYNSGKECSFEDVRDGVYWRYKETKQEKIPKILICDSPIECQLFYNFCNKFIDVNDSTAIIGGADKLIFGLWKTIGDKVMIQIKKQMSPEAFFRFEREVWTRVYRAQPIDESKSFRENDLEYYESHNNGLAVERWWIEREFFKRIGVETSQDYDKWTELYLKGVWTVDWFDTTCFISKLPISSRFDIKGESESFSEIEFRGYDYFGVRDTFMGKNIDTYYIDTGILKNNKCENIRYKK
jgi:hypothetical protein